MGWGGGEVGELLFYGKSLPKYKKIIPAQLLGYALLLCPYPLQRRAGCLRGRNKITVAFLLQLVFTPKFQFCFLLLLADIRHDGEKLCSTKEKTSRTYWGVKWADLSPLRHSALSSLVREEMLIPVYSSDEQMGGISSLSLMSHRGLKKGTNLVRFFQKVGRLSHHKGWCVVPNGAAEG